MRTDSFINEVRKRPITFISIGFILLMTLLAICAYLIIPDNTPAANTQIPEIALMPAGFTAQILEVPSSELPKGKPWQSIMYGKSSQSQVYAFDSIGIHDQGIYLVNAVGIPKIIEVSGDTNQKAAFIDEHVRRQTYWLGTDKYGRDMLSRVILGIRISLIAGFMAVLVSLLIGLTLGSIAGYFGGLIDQVVMYLINVTWSIPTVLLVFAIVLALGRGISVIFLAIGLTMWVDVARIVRGQVLSIKEEQYVMAAKSIGQSHKSIIIKHIWPNILGPVMVILAANFATAILVEAGLSYLGFGVNPPEPSLGNILNENYGYAMSGRYVLSVVPAMVIMLLVLSFNLLGSGLRDYFDVKE